MSDASSSSPRPLTDAGPVVGEIIAAKYVVESLLGVGGMGVVVAARHVQLNQRVAIKLLRREEALGAVSTSRFLREARAAAAITSEHVARVLDVGTLESGLPFIVMEHLSGCDLAALVDTRGALPHGEAVALLLQACEAIAEAHALGIIHRDLKPSNVFVTHRADGTVLVKVLDFGISKIQNPIAFAGDDATLTASGSVVGSPAYMSPEQIRSAKGTDARSDVWAMGVILFELLTGKNPFIGETLGDTLVKIASEPAPPLGAKAPDVPEGLALVVAQCLERDLARRIASIADLARALEPYAGGEGSISIERIVRVSASLRPLSVTPSDGGSGATPQGRSTPGARPRFGTEGAWHRSRVFARKRSALWIVGVAVVTGAAIVGGVFARVAAQRRAAAALADAQATALPAEQDAGPAVDAAPSASVARIDVAAPLAEARDASARPPPPRGNDRGRGHHGPSPRTADTAPPAAPPPPPPPASASARSLDDLLEGRH